MAGGRADTYDQRAEILGGIVTRNHVVGALRVIVPALGVAAFAALVGQIYLSNLVRQYGVSGIRVDRGVLVVETPQYEGISGSGARYVVSAGEARSPLDQSNEILMSDVTLQLDQPLTGSLFARAEEATMDTQTELVRVDGVVTLTGIDGLQGTLTDVKSDIAKERLTSGPVDLVLSDGTTIVAETMLHEGARNRWTFRRATVVMADLPGAEK